MKKLLVVVVLSLGLSSPGFASDLLLVVLEDGFGKQSAHYQPSRDCLAFLAAFKDNQKRNVLTTLTFEESIVARKVLDAYCVKSDGTIVDSDGFSYKRISKEKP